MRSHTVAALLLVLAISSASATDNNNQKLKHKLCHIVAEICMSKCGTKCCYGTTDNSGNSMNAVCAAEESKLAAVSSYCCKATGPVDDPIFHDFSDRSFEFLGQAGKIYNVFTDKDTSVNMRLVDAGPKHIRLQAGDGTFADAIAITVTGTKILAEVNEEGDMTVTIDGEEQDVDQAFTVTKGSAVASFDPTVPDQGEVLEVSNDMYTFTLTAVREFEDETSGFNRGHLNLVTVIKTPPGAMEGVLGSTLLQSAVSGKDNSEAFSDEGYESEYVVDDLFSGLPMPTSNGASTSRRRLIEGSALRTDLVFPLTASYGSRQH